MADIFKDGILYMDDIHDSDIFSDIIKEQLDEDNKKLREEKEQANKSERELLKETIQRLTNECIKEVYSKIVKYGDNEILFNEDGIIECSNGCAIKTVEKDGKTVVSIIYRVKEGGAKNNG